MNTENRTDLPCRAKCPFYNGKLDRTLRPCVTKVEGREEKCIKNITDCFSSPASGTLNLKPDRKRIIVLRNNFPIGTVANGMAAWIKHQS